MLVISRGHKESIILLTKNGKITVTVWRDRIRNEIKVGFDAPQSVRILREERENESS